MPDDPCRDCREYVDRLLEERHRTDQIRDRWLADKFKDLERAVDKTDRQVTDKFHTVNEMREQLDRGEGKFALKENVDRIEQIVANWQGRLVIVGAVWGLILMLGAWALQHVKP